jgi:hypothetical protein
MAVNDLWIERDTRSPALAGEQAWRVLFAMSMGPPTDGCCQGGWDHPGCQLMDHPARLAWFVQLARDGRDGVPGGPGTDVFEVLRTWLAGAGKRPAAARAGVNVKTAARYIRAAQEAGLDRGGGEGQLTDDLIGLVVAAVRPGTARRGRPLRRGRATSPGG